MPQPSNITPIRELTPLDYELIAELAEDRGEEAARWKKRAYIMLGVAMLGWGSFFVAAWPK